MGIRPRLRNQLGTRARCSRHQRPRYPPERHAGVGQRHEQQRSTDSWNPYTRFDPTYTAAANVTKLADAHTLRFGGAIDYQAMNHCNPSSAGRDHVDVSISAATSRGCGAVQPPKCRRRQRDHRPGQLDGAQIVEELRRRELVAADATVDRAELDAGGGLSAEERRREQRRHSGTHEEIRDDPPACSSE